MNYRNKANITLTVVFIAFVLAAVARHSYPSVLFYRLIYFVLEAALVGGLADWFAVTALFREPLGFPYHTALIPRNRKKVVGGVTNMVEGELLSKDTIKTKIGAVRFDRLLIDLIENNPGYKHKISNQTGQALLGYINNLDRAWAASKLAQIIGIKLQQLQTGATLQKVILWVFAQRMDEKWLDYGFTELERLAAGQDTREKLHRFLQSQKREQTRDNFLKNLVAGFLESTDSLNLEEASRVLQDTLVENLQEFRQPSHPVRLKIKEILLQTLAELDKSPAWLLSTERWKREVLVNLPLEEGLLALVNSLIEAATQPVTTGSGCKAPVATWVEYEINIYWERFKQDRNMGDWFDKWCKEIILRLVEAEHYLIGEIVSQTLDSLSDDDLNKFIEDKAGNDLQWIRINGSIVGGAIGLILFFLLTYVYDPMVVPLVQGWFKQ